MRRPLGAPVHLGEKCGGCPTRARTHRRGWPPGGVAAPRAAGYLPDVDSTLIRRVLLVEDDPGMREAIRALLVRAGYQVSSAADGVQAWELLSRGPRPAAILVDLYTPRMSGSDLVARVRRTPRLAAVPIIAMSGERATRDRPVAEAFLEKPFSREQLEWALEHAGA